VALAPPVYQRIIDAVGEVPYGCDQWPTGTGRGRPNLHRANEPGNVLLEVGEGNLPKQSIVVVSQVSSVEKARLGERIGSLSDARVEQILAGLRFQQVSFFRR
jgi:hypothetical protein